MQLLEEYVAARVNAAEDARLRAERELLRQVHEHRIFLRWREALQARRTVRGPRAARRGEEALRGAAVENGTGTPVAASEHDLARTAR